MSLRQDLITSFTAKPKGEQMRLVSLYNPGGKERSRLLDITKDFGRADVVRNGSYEEFGHKRLIDIINRDRRRFNNYIDIGSDDPDEAWKANTIRPVTRNKVISIAAHITSSLLFPQIFAQNDADEEDRNAADVMRDLNLWANEQSDYAEKFVKAIVKSLVDPAMVMYEGYAEVMRKVKVITSKGDWTEQEIMDELFSGFQNLVVPIEELYIGNAYEGCIQKQPFLIWRKVIDFEEAKTKYSGIKNFDKYVRPGVKVFYVDNSDGFYEGSDDNLTGTQVEEVIYYNRYADLELRVINGVLIDDPDRPIQRVDKMYPFAKTGYEYFAGTDFFYYKSLVDKMSSDQTVIDTLYNMIIDGTYLQIMPPAVVLGDEEIDSGVMIPGSVTTMGEETKFQTLSTNNNLNAGMNMLQKVESSLSESSMDPMQAGQGSPGTPPTAFEVSRLEANAKTVLGLFGKMVSKFVEDFGKLRVNTILQYMTVADVVDIVGDSGRIKFRNFLVKDEESGEAKKIEFDMETTGDLGESFEIYEREEETGGRILKVNPDLFRKNKYMVKVKADFMPTQSEAVRKALNLEAYDRLIQNPYANHEAVTADFLVETYKPGESDKYIKKAAQEAPGGMIPSGNSNMTSQILNKSEAGAIG